MRAWGPLEWLLRKLPAHKEPLYVLGALAAEERCVAVPTMAVNYSAKRILLLKISDPASRYTLRAEQKMEKHANFLRGILGDTLEIRQHGIFDGDELIVEALQVLLCDAPASAELWIDISSLPKRFFFLLIKLALRRAQVQNLVVAYAQPAPGRYTDAHLSEDPSDVQPLPGFGLVKSDPGELIVAVGFEALGLPQLLGEFRDKKWFIILPFPPGQPYSRRIWQTVMSVGHPGDANIKRVPALDTFGAFDVMKEDIHPDILEARPPALAPYGPKPISLAMCLYGIQYGSPVLYTQPRVYHPDYTLGIGQVWAYSLKRKGQETWG